MALLTEEVVRQMSNGGTRGPVVVSRDDVLTPSARSWLREHRVEVVYPQGRAAEGETSAPAGDRARYQTLFGAALDHKPEHMTHLNGDFLVVKDHPRIIFRGKLDTLESELILCQLTDKGLEAPVGEILELARRIIRCEVLDEPLQWDRLCGLTEDEQRKRSHFPQDYYGQPHFMPSAADGAAIARLNRARCAAREAELAAVTAFRDREGNPTRVDILRAMNRMSSMLYLLMIGKRADAGRGKER